MKNNIIYLLIFFLSITFTSCEKDEISTPNKNTSEKNLNITPFAPPIYDFPFRGEDIKPKERVYTKNHAQGFNGSQSKGKDIHVKRYLGNNKWDRLKDGTNGSKNSDDVIYGKPIYAISNGTIISGWRNAPENPADGTNHPFIGQKLIAFGGNTLRIRQADGSVISYSHMIPGSIPPALCPHEESSFPAPYVSSDREYTRYDVSDRVNVVKGQFLGRVGNSGNSTGPHLHIHIQKNNQPREMRFKKGAAKTYIKNNTTLLSGWQSFNGQEIPPGQVLIDAPRRRPYRMFDFESFKIGNKQRYTGLFKPGNYNSAFYALDSWTKFINKRSSLKSKGFRLIDFDSYKVGSKRMYSGIFKPGSYDSGIFIYSNFTDFNTKRISMKSKGFRLIDFESYKIGSTRKYVGVFKAANYGSKFYILNNWTDFNTKRLSLRSQGYNLIDFESYKSGNKRMYAGVFKRTSTTSKFYLLNGWTKFRDKRNALRSQGYRLIDIESYTSGNKQMYAGIFTPGSYTPAVYTKDDWEDFQEGWRYLK